ncbi:MAG: InlB B-repeat-containing protein, partial [Spirochaetales bacterium]|nr:InlB B-repeat-containing protein [Spirochaetales bacterium]
MKNKLTIVFLFSILCSCSDLFDNSIIEPIIIPQVIFNANGGTGTMSNQSFTVGEPQELSVNIFTRAGYTFTCWNTQADGSGTSYGDKQSVTFSTETPLILYAQWKKNVTVTYTEVIFNANGGTGTMSNQSFTVGEPQELSVNIFTRAGYTFTGWNTQADG